MRSTQGSGPPIPAVQQFGRGKRMGLAGPDRPEDELRRPPKAKTPRLKAPRLKAPRTPRLMTPRLKAPRFKAPCLQGVCERGPAESSPSPPALERAEAVKLRCVGITPRLLSLVELLPLWRRQRGRGHYFLRPSAARRLELLRAAFSSDARNRDAIGTSRRSDPAAAGRGRLSAAQYHNFQRR